MHTHESSDPTQHGHLHAHGAEPGREKRLWLAFGLTSLMLVLEAVGGWWSGSLALLTDAAHMLVDALALLMAVVAVLVARRPADARRSYGYARVEVLAGFASALLQFVLTIFIVIEAIGRLWHPTAILSRLMLVVAVAGLLINIVVLATLHEHDEDDVNMGAAWLHVLGDLLGSVGAVVAAILIGALGWLRADPILSVLVSILILRSAWRLLRRSVHILLEGVPEGLETEAMLAALRRSHPAICDVHHLHVWQLASGSRMATLHVSVLDPAHEEAAMQAVKDVLAGEFRVEHTTVQVELGACPDEPGDPAHH